MANAIAYWRKKRKMSQQDLADLIGIDRAVLSRVENPNIPIDPTEELALKISRILNVVITDIYRDPKKNFIIKDNNK